MENIKEKIENTIKKVISCRLIYYIIAIIAFFVVYYVNFKSQIANEQLTNGNHLKYFIIGAAISALAILFILIFSKKLYQKFQPHIVYTIIALIVGGMYIFIIPLCAQSDEPAHIYRTFQVAKGEIISPIINGEYITELPKSIVDMVQVNSENKKKEYKKYYDIKEMMKIELNENDTINITTVGNYCGISYFPQAIGVKIGMILKLNPYFSAMLGRITGLIIMTLLLALGIKKIPKHKMFATIILISPVCLSYIASFSADGIIIVATFLMISYVLKYMHTKEKIKILDYIILAILTCIISISKMAYIPIIGILLFIPRDCFKKHRKKWIFSIIYIILGILSAFAWLKISDTGVSSGDPSFTNTWIYSNPIEYGIILIRTTISNIYSYIENAFAGHFLCHNQVNPFEIVPFTYIILVIASFFCDENKEKTTMYQKIIIIGIILSSYVLISTAMYVFNTAFKHDLIIGVQGRYLVPLILLMIFFGNNKKIDIREERLTNIALIANYAVYLAMMAEFFI